MEEKTPIIILTAVFAVAVVGFILYFSTANTGMYNIYGDQSIADKTGRVSSVIGGRERAVSATYRPLGVDTFTGEAYKTAEGKDPGNLGFVSKTGYNEKLTVTRAANAYDSTCLVYSLETGEQVYPTPGWNLAKPKAERVMDRLRAECFKQGEYLVTDATGVRDVAAQRPAWEYCCYYEENPTY